MIGFIFTIFAVYRLSQFLPYDDGPRFTFARIRDWAEKKKDSDDNEHGFWHGLDGLITCVFCQGVWWSLVCGLLYYYQTGHLFLIIFGLAGMQTWLQNRKHQQGQI